MKRFASLVGVAVALASAPLLVGQRGGSPFIDHSDTGETVHVLPPPAAIRSPHDTGPTDAPAHTGLATYSASYGSGNLINHGGHQIPTAGFYAIYWNQAVANSPASQPGYSSLKNQIEGFVTAFSGLTGQNYSQSDPSADYTVVQQYGSRDSISPYLLWAGDFVDSQSSKGTISDFKIQTYLAGLFGNGRLLPEPNTIYGIYFPSGVKITLTGGTSCSSFCGYHGHFNYRDTNIKYAVFPYTDCRACSLPGKAVADILTIVSSHEIREAVTDPDLNAWYDSAGYEADDKCAWHNLYKMTKGGFWVQPEFSNGGTVNGIAYPAGCVVPNAN